MKALNNASDRAITYFFVQKAFYRALFHPRQRPTATCSDTQSVNEEDYLDRLMSVASRSRISFGTSYEVKDKI